MVLTSGRDVRIDGTNSETSTADLKLYLNPKPFPIVSAVEISMVHNGGGSYFCR